MRNQQDSGEGKSSENFQDNSLAADSCQNNICCVCGSWHGQWCIAGGSRNSSQRTGNLPYSAAFLPADAAMTKILDFHDSINLASLSAEKISHGEKNKFQFVFENRSSNG